MGLARLIVPLMLLGCAERVNLVTGDMGLGCFTNWVERALVVHPRYGGDIRGGPHPGVAGRVVRASRWR